MSGNKIVFCVSMMVFSLLLATTFGESQIDDITCSEAEQNVAPCLPYLIGFQPNPPAACCQGASVVFKRADTTQTRRNLCECLKTGAKNLFLKADRLEQLPQLCHISLSFSISPNVNCSS